MGISLLDRSMLYLLQQLAHGLAHQFGKNCEVVVHELDPWRQDSNIVVVENGHVSSRKEGDDPCQVALAALKQDGSNLQDKLAYLTKTSDGRILKSSTMYIRDGSGMVCALLSIHYDITAFLAAQESLATLTATEQTSNGRGQGPENVPLNVNQLLDELIAQSIRLVGKPTGMMTKEDKIKAIRFLSNAGAFLITKSGDRVAREFGISKYTLYSYIDAGKAE